MRGNTHAHPHRNQTNNDMRGSLAMAVFAGFYARPSDMLRTIKDTVPSNKFDGSHTPTPSLLLNDWRVSSWTRACVPVTRTYVDTCCAWLTKRFLFLSSTLFLLVEENKIKINRLKISVASLFAAVQRFQLLLRKGGKIRKKWKRKGGKQRVQP